jgi:hypothetical protein
MEFDQSRIDALVARPSESLNVEIKRWIRPDEPNGISKIVRSALAVRNRNGGYLIIGFDDKTLQPDVCNEPPNIRALFHHDKIQALISRYASDLFEVGVVYGHRDGHEYPVIVVPEGVRSPVAAKAALMDRDKTLLRAGDVYFRTLAANGTPSTARARPQDWPAIIEICFDNREADVGRFLRRQLAGQDVTALTSVLNDLALGSRKAPTLNDRATALLDDGLKRFRQAIAERKLRSAERTILETGSWEVALVFDPPLPDRLPDLAFLRTIASSNPQYTGWPIWIDSQGFVDRSAAPIVKDKGWEALIISLDGWSKHVDFLRFDPEGEFYQWRNLEDDVNEQVRPRTALDPIVVILRVAESIAVGLAFANAFGLDSENTRLGFAFRWTKLKGRELRPWAKPMTPISATDLAHDDVATTFVELSLDTPASAIAPYVEKATQALFVLFGGYQLPIAAIEHWVRGLIERKL